MQLPCANFERIEPDKQHHITLVKSAVSGDVVTWLEEWFRHERQTVDERQRAMMSQIGTFLRSDASSRGPGTASGETQGAQSSITEKRAVELVDLMQSSNKQVQELSVELRTTYSEIGVLRTTIEASKQESIKLQQQRNPGTATPDDKLPSSPPQPITDGHAANGGGPGSKPSDAKGDAQKQGLQHQSTKQDYSTGALRAFNKAGDEDMENMANASLYQKFLIVVHHDGFEISFGILILLSAAALALEIQYEGLAVGYDIRYPGYAEASWYVWPWAKDTFIWLERVFTTLFTIELIMRLLAMRQKCLRDRWMYLDCFVVFFSLLALFGNSPIKMNVTVLRIVRIGRMLRILRIVRFIRFFDSLYLMIRSVQSSWSALIWSFVLLMLVQMISGMIVCQIIMNWIEDSDDDEANRRLFNYFGTFSRTTLTMWEIMMANWITPARLLVNTCGEPWTLFFLFYRCMMGFALLAVISAVFIHETMKVADTDDEVAVFIQQRDTQIYTEKLREAFKELDDSGDGFVNWQELSQIMEDEIMKSWLKSMQIDTSQVHNLFNVLDDGDGKISFQEFMSGIQKVKGAAKSIDVVMLKKMVTNLDKKISKLRVA